MSAITSSARSCPHQMIQVFAILREAASKKFSGTQCVKYCAFTLHVCMCRDS